MNDFDYLFWQGDIIKDIKYVIKKRENLVRYYKNLTIERDENYQLICTITGNVDKRSKRDPFERNTAVGELIKPIRINATDKSGHIKVELKGVYLKDQFIKYQEHEIHAKGEANQILIQYSELGEVEFENIWYLNGEKDFLYPGSVSSRINGQINYHIHDFIKVETPLFPYQGRHGARCIKLKYLNIEFILGYVEPEENFPATFLTFKKSHLPSEKELLKIEVFVQLILGLQIRRVGKTRYGKDLEVLSEQHYDPHCYIDNLTAATKTMPLPTAHRKAYVQFNINNVENEISKLSLEFDKKFNCLNFELVIQYINVARRLPVDIQLQPLSTALEIFQKSWFNSKYSSSKGLFINEKDFEENLKKIRKIISENFSGDIEKLFLKQIHNANFVSQSQRYILLAKEIGLNIGDVEKKALLERHKVVHGVTEEIDYEGLILKTRAFYTLVNRFLLASLKYTGAYIDFSSYDEPSRKMNEIQRFDL